MAVVCGSFGVVDLVEVRWWVGAEVGWAEFWCGWIEWVSSSMENFV